MQKKRMAAILCTVLLLCLGWYFWYRHTMSNKINGMEEQLPPMAMAEGRLYQLSEVLDGGPSRKPDGFLTEYIGNQVPSRNGEFNFGEAEIPYWKTQAGLCVYIRENTNYLLLKESDIQE